MDERLPQLALPPLPQSAEGLMEWAKQFTDALSAWAFDMQQAEVITYTTTAAIAATGALTAPTGYTGTVSLPANGTVYRIPFL